MAKKTEDNESEAAAIDLPQVGLTNTKKEMLDAYNAALKKLQEKRQAELRPEKIVEERKAQELTKSADALSTDGVVQAIAGLRVSVGKMLAGLADQLEDEVGRYQRIKEAVELRQKETQEVYGIEAAAGALAALIEAQDQKRAEFEAEMAARKQELSSEIEETRRQWEQEEAEREQQKKEQEQAEQRARARTKEEYDYGFKREQRLAQDKFADETARLQKEMAERKEAMDKELAERQRIIVAREEELKQLQAKVGAFPAELDKAVARAVKEAVDRAAGEAKNREGLMSKEFEGERKSLNTRIEAMESTIAEQGALIAKLSGQLEAAYQKVQDIAVKAIEGSANLKTLTEVQKMLGDRGRSAGAEK